MLCDVNINQGTNDVPVENFHIAALIPNRDMRTLFSYGASSLSDLNKTAQTCASLNTVKSTKGGGEWESHFTKTK